MQKPLIREDLSKALKRLDEKLLSCQPAIVVDQRWEVMRNGSHEWARVRFQGEYQGLETLVPVLNSYKELLAQDFNLRVLIHLDRNSGALNLLILDGEEVVVVGSFNAPSRDLIVEPEVARPQLAIVIDDMGHSLESAAEFSALPLPLTFAIFPLLKNSLKVASHFVDHHCDIILHAPMEPRGYPLVDPGPGALFISMGDEEVCSVFLEDLQFIPGIIGVNNHMGSRLTADPQKMALVMEMLKGRDLFFLDSRTIADSAAYEKAVEAGIPALQRDIFLDNVPDVEHIMEQFRALIEVATIKGRAIGIGHPYPVTATALALLPEMANRAGVEIVAVRELVNH
ncbi:MAG: divergent polysaccharide deacetylase family protein [Pseudomonadota bacterium]|nr:divergent polysaccharide deacetylase family protein [Pseudomonadota bacterium]